MLSPGTPRSKRAVATAAVPMTLVVLGLVANSHPYWMLLATSGAIALILTTAFNLSYGYAGIFNMSIVAIYGIGAFTSVYAEVHLGWNFWLTLPVAVVVSAALSVLIAIPSRRLNELFLAIETLAFALAVSELIKNWESFSGGSNGVYAVPVPSIFGRTLLGGDLAFYWLAAIAAAVTYELARRIHRSGMGRQFIALREGPRVLASVGASTGTVSLTAFALSGAIAGLAGVLFGRYQLFISLEGFGFQRLTVLLLATILGGAGYLWGPFVGVAVLLLMDELSIATSQDWELIFGATILVVVFLGRGGLAGVVAERLAAWRRTRPAPAWFDQELAAAASVESDVTPRRIGHLAVDGLTVAFGGTTAVSDVSLRVSSGEVVGLIGPNGAGKTSLLNAITGDVKATGSADLNGTALLGRSQEAVVRLGVGRTFQSPQFVPDLTVLENLLLAGDGMGRAGLLSQIVHGRRARRAEAEDRRTALRLLDDFGIAHVALQPAKDQTYGVLRIAEVARNLMLDPNFLLLDEPGAGLTEDERVELAEHIRRVRARGIGVLLIDHNLSLITSTCDRVYALDHGVVIAEGTPRDVLAHSDVVSAYLGTA